MSIELPRSEKPFFPQVPIRIREREPDTYEFLERVRRYITESQGGLFDNTRVLTDAINSGTCGVFIVATSTLSIENGIVISVTE